MDIFQKVEELSLPKDTYVVVGGGTLVALGLLEWDEDVDIAVTPELFARFKTQGWRQEEWGDKPILKHDVYDIGVGFGKWSLEDLSSDVMTLNGFPFMSINKLLEWKREMARPKDLLHVQLLEQYLRDHAHPLAR